MGWKIIATNSVHPILPYLKRNVSAVGLWGTCSKVNQFGRKWAFCLVYNKAEKGDALICDTFGIYD